MKGYEPQAELIQEHICTKCSRKQDAAFECCGPTRAIYSTRTKVAFGRLKVIGPHNVSSNKWTLDMGHSSLALYWAKDPERATTELAELRAALDFIEAQL